MRRLVAVVSALAASCATRQAPPTPPPSTAVELPPAPLPNPVDLANAYQSYLGRDRVLSIPGFRALAATWPRTDDPRNPDPPGPLECNAELSPSSTRRSSDGTWIAVEGTGGVVILDAETGDMKRFLALPGYLSLRDEIPGTSLFVVEQSLPSEVHTTHLLVVDPKSGTVVATFDSFDGSSVTAVAPGKLAYVSATRSPGVASLHVWDARSRHELMDVGVPGNVWMAFFQDGALLAVNDDHVHLWDLPPTGDIRDWTTPETFYGSSPEMQPGGTLIAYPHARGVRLVDAKTHLTVATSNECPDESKTTSWSSDGTLLAVGAGLHACVLEVPSLRLRVKTPDLRAPRHTVGVVDSSTEVRFLGSSGLMVHDRIWGSTKVFEVPSMKVVWGGVTGESYDGAAAAAVLKVIDVPGAPDAKMSIVTIEPDSVGSFRVTRRKATPDETAGTARPPEAHDKPQIAAIEAAARMASNTVLPLHGHIVPKEVCVTPSPSSAPPPASSRDAGPYTAFLDALDAEHVRYVIGSDSGFYVEASVPQLCLPVHEPHQHADGQAAPLQCWEWPRALPRVTGDPSPDYGSTGTLTRVTVQAGETTVVLAASATKDGVTLKVSSVRVRARPTTKAMLADELEYTMPPSRRPRSRPNPPRPGSQGLVGVALTSAAAQASTVARALEAFSQLNSHMRIRSAEHAGTNLVSLSSEAGGAGMYEQIWTCQRGLGPRACAPSDTGTRLGEFTAIDAEKTLPAGWLVVAHDSYTPRGGETALVWVSVRDGALKASEIGVGGVGGIGSHCDPADGQGYCVSVSGTWTPFELVAPDCVNVRPSVHWSSVHDRMGDRWLHETREPANDSDVPPGTYRAGPDGWKREACPSSSSPPR